MVVVRKLHRWGWLLRYWWLDKYAREARALSLAVAVIVLALAVVDLWLRVAHVGPQRAYWQIIYYVVVFLLAAYAAYAARAKVPQPDPQQGQTPEVKDGRALREVFGSVWITDPTIVSWVNGAPEPIQRKGGKK